MTILPGRRGLGIGGYHRRDLEADAALLTEFGVQTFVLLVEDHELIGSGLPNFVEMMKRRGIAVLRCPIVDGQTPRDISHASRWLLTQNRDSLDPVPGDLSVFRALLVTIETQLRAGATIAVSCRAGLGRTGVLAACLLINGGLDPVAAIMVTRRCRKGTIENSNQVAFVRDWPAATTDLP